MDRNEDGNASLTITAAATTLAIAICLASLALFATIFIALQAVSRRRESSMGYTQLAMMVDPPDDTDADDSTQLVT